MTLKHPLWEALGAILTQSSIPAKLLYLFSLGIPFLQLQHLLLQFYMLLPVTFYENIRIRLVHGVGATLA